MNAVLSLSSEERSRGVVTHSSGNHAQALALAARLAEVEACVVMPTSAPAVKREATLGYGARVVSCEPTLAAREATVSRLIDENGFILIHPYDNWSVIAGQGTAAWELFDEAGNLDLLLAPCGGGGLLSGTSLAAAGRSPGTRVVGSEPAAADDAKRSLEAGRILPSEDPKTVADGLRTSLGPRTFAVLTRLECRIVTASEEEILAAMRTIWERLKIVIEPSAAVPVACLFNGQVDVQNQRVGVILSGGNVDLSRCFEAWG
jgi:threonine dehydratase